METMESVQKIRGNLTMYDEVQLEDFRLAFLAVWRKKLFVLAVAVFTGLIGWFVTFDEKAINTYQAETSVYSIATGSEQELKYLSTALISYAGLVSSNKVCERAATLVKGNVSLKAADIQRMIGVNSVNDSVIAIHAVSTDPQISIAVTNAVAESFVREMTGITANDAIQILDPADSVTVNRNGVRSIFMKRFLAVFAGAVISSAYIMGGELFSNKIRSVVQCIESDENEILGIIPLMENELR